MAYKCDCGNDLKHIHSKFWLCWECYIIHEIEISKNWITITDLFYYTKENINILQKRKSEILDYEKIMLMGEC